MAKKESSSRKKDKSRRKPHQRERNERRFVPTQSVSAMLTMAGAVLGGLAVGGGGYGQFMTDPRVAYAPWLMAGGAVVLAGVVIWGDMQGTVIRVGDAGVGVEEADKPMKRTAWCDFNKIRVEDGAVHLESEGGVQTFKIASNPAAAAWIVREAEERVPKRVTVGSGQRDLLPETSSHSGEMVKVEATQITGRRCKASDEVITFERDALLCERCGEVYLRKAAPKKCETCGGPLSEADDEGTTES